MSKHLFTVIVLLLAFLWKGCGKKDTPVKLMIIGNDTLTYKSIEAIKSGSSENLLKRNALLIAGAKKSGKKIDDKSIITDFRERLELESGEEWDDKGAEVLYKMAFFIKNELTSKSVKPSQFIGDISKTIKADLGYTFPQNLDKDIPANADSGFSRVDLEAIVKTLFALNDRTSKVVSEFVFMDDSLETGDADVDKMISGLVFDSAAAAEKEKLNSKKTASKKVVDNSKNLIKYRSLESIKDSIAKHSPNIQALYKKVLKINEGISGVVFIKFRVNEAGSVIDASISRSDINNKELHENLMSYAQNIKFKAIPEGKGKMTFDFPFEFRPE